MEQSRMESHSRDSDRRREMNLRDVSDIDLRNRERGSVHEWEEERPQRNHGRMTGQEEVRQRAPYHRNRNTNVGPAPRMDFSEQETLKIKVDMSRPVGQSRYSIIVIPHLVRVKSSCLFSCPLSPNHEDLKNDNLQIVKDKKIQWKRGVASRKPTDEPLILCLSSCTWVLKITPRYGYSRMGKLSKKFYNFCSRFPRYPVWISRRALKGERFACLDMSTEVQCHPLWINHFTQTRESWDVLRIDILYCCVGTQMYMSRLNESLDVKATSQSFKKHWWLQGPAS